mgnify:CR=1 FL=1
MKVTLVHDSSANLEGGNGLPEDFGAEYDDPATVEGLLSALRDSGHEADSLEFDEEFPARIRERNPDLVFNIAEGARGPARESLVPGWLDHLGIPYTGSDGLALGVTLDKALSKTIMAHRGWPTPAFARVRDRSQVEDLDLPFPLFAKPNNEGSSMGIRRASRLEDEASLRQQVEWILSEYSQDCLVEEFLPGREFCVGLLGNGNPTTLPIVEIRSPGQFYSYEYKARHNKELICPADLPEEIAEEIREMGRDAFAAFRCRDLGRVDVKLDKNGRPGFLEINPLPGLSADYSIYPYQALQCDMTYNELISRIVNLAVERTTTNTERIST